MELTGERLIPATRATTWAALNDPAVLKACIAGCESLERAGDDAFDASVAVRVGPVSARFKGRLQLLDVQPPERYTIQFEGQGGAAGFGKGSADVSLVDEGASTRLRYAARAQVGGRIAQVGSRLVDAAAAKIADDFFSAFETKLRPAEPVPAEAAPTAAAGAPTAAPAARNAWLLRLGVALVALVVIYLVFTSAK
jgi:carbon monoxide dehydrogenase subunit G